MQSPSEPRRLTQRLSTVISSWDFTPDGGQILCTLVPEERGQEPEQPLRPVGPNIQESIGNTSPVRTYQDLLQNPYDEALLSTTPPRSQEIVDGSPASYRPTSGWMPVVRPTIGYFPS